MTRICSTTDANPRKPASCPATDASLRQPAPCSIKLCGLTRLCDIKAANELMPDYIGFVFAPGSRRYVPPQKAKELKKALAPEIKAVGVFVDEAAETVAAFLNQGLIDLAQLHGNEDGEYVRKLRTLTSAPLIQAIRTRTKADLAAAMLSNADYLLLDSGAGTGKTFDWKLIQGFPAEARPCFLAGGLTPDNVGEALRQFSPYGVDVSSGIETDGVKDRYKMAAFVAAVRKETMHTETRYENDKS